MLTNHLSPSSPSWRNRILGKHRRSKGGTTSSGRPSTGRENIVRRTSTTNKKEKGTFATATDQRESRHYSQKCRIISASVSGGGGGIIPVKHSDTSSNSTSNNSSSGCGGREDNRIVGEQQHTLMTTTTTLPLDSEVQQVDQPPQVQQDTNEKRRVGVSPRRTKNNVPKSPPRTRRSVTASGAVDTADGVSDHGRSQLFHRHSSLRKFRATSETTTTKDKDGGPTTNCNDGTSTVHHSSSQQQQQQRISSSSRDQNISSTMFTTLEELPPSPPPPPPPPTPPDVQPLELTRKASRVNGSIQKVSNSTEGMVVSVLSDYHPTTDHGAIDGTSGGPSRLLLQQPKQPTRIHPHHRAIPGKKNRGGGTATKSFSSKSQLPHGQKKMVAPDMWSNLLYKVMKEKQGGVDHNDASFCNKGSPSSSLLASSPSSLDHNNDPSISFRNNNKGSPSSLLAGSPSSALPIVVVGENDNTTCGSTTTRSSPASSVGSSSVSDLIKPTESATASAASASAKHESLTHPQQHPNCETSYNNNATTNSTTTTTTRSLASLLADVHHHHHPNKKGQQTHKPIQSLEQHQQTLQQMRLGKASDMTTTADKKLKKTQSLSAILNKPPPSPVSFAGKDGGAHTTTTTTTTTTAASSLSSSTKTENKMKKIQSLSAILKQQPSTPVSFAGHHGAHTPTTTTTTASSLSSSTTTENKMKKIQPLSAIPKQQPSTPVSFAGNHGAHTRTTTTASSLWSSTTTENKMKKIQPLSAVLKQQPSPSFSGKDGTHTTINAATAAFSSSLSPDEWTRWFVSQACTPLSSQGQGQGKEDDDEVVVVPFASLLPSWQQIKKKPNNHCVKKIAFRDKSLHTDNDAKAMANYAAMQEMDDNHTMELERRRRRRRRKENNKMNKNGNRRTSSPLLEGWNSCSMYLNNNSNRLPHHPCGGDHHSHYHHHQENGDSDNNDELDLEVRYPLLFTQLRPEDDRILFEPTTPTTPPPSLLKLEKECGTNAGTTTQNNNNKNGEKKKNGEERMDKGGGGRVVHYVGSQHMIDMGVVIDEVEKYKVIVEKDKDDHRVKTHLYEISSIGGRSGSSSSSSSSSNNSFLVGNIEWSSRSSCNSSW